MRYLIDGYNLLFAWLRVPRSTRPGQFQRARHNLLQRLHFAGAAARGDVTVVFDGQHAPPGAAAAMEHHGLHVRFCHDGAADDLIEELLRHEGGPHQLTVISDDHRLREAARRRHCHVLGCLDYIEALQQPQAQPAPPAPPDPAAKPEAPSPEETRQLLEAFGEADAQEPGP